MTSPLTRGSLLDEFFKEVAPGFFIKPLHGDPVPGASQIRIDVSRPLHNLADHPAEARIMLILSRFA